MSALLNLRGFAPSLRHGVGVICFVVGGILGFPRTLQGRQEIALLPS